MSGAFCIYLPMPMQNGHREGACLFSTPLRFKSSLKCDCCLRHLCPRNHRRWNTAVPTFFR